MKAACKFRCLFNQGSVEKSPELCMRSPCVRHGQVCELGRGPLPHRLTAVQSMSPFPYHFPICNVLKEKVLGRPSIVAATEERGRASLEPTIIERTVLGPFAWCITELGTENRSASALPNVALFRICCYFLPSRGFQGERKTCANPGTRQSPIETLSDTCETSS